MALRGFGLSLFNGVRAVVNRTKHSRCTHCVMIRFQVVSGIALCFANPAIRVASSALALGVIGSTNVRFTRALVAATRWLVGTSLDQCVYIGGIPVLVWMEKVT